MRWGSFFIPSIATHFSSLPHTSKFFVEKLGSKNESFEVMKERVLKSVTF
jgi:hypothetical protein